MKLWRVAMEVPRLRCARVRGKHKPIRASVVSPTLINPKTPKNIYDIIICFNYDCVSRSIQWAKWAARALDTARLSFDRSLAALSAGRCASCAPDGGCGPATSLGHPQSMHSRTGPGRNILLIHYCSCIFFIEFIFKNGTVLFLIGVP